MPSEEQVNEIRWAVSAIAAQNKRVRLYAEYYQGKHRLMIQQERLRSIFGELFANFRLNLCSAVVDALADRLQVQGFSDPRADEERKAREEAGQPDGVQPEAETEDILDAGEIAQEIWKRNRMRRRMGQIHQSAISAGEAFVLVWPDKQGNPIVYPQKPTEIALEYDPESPGRIVRAAKLWKEKDGSHRLNLYYPERIEKYETRVKVSGGATSYQNFEVRRVPGEAWPLPNIHGQVPLFHFANNSDLGEAGVSELRDAIPVQDGLNKSVFDMLVGGEFMAYPQRYAMNIEVKTRRNDRTGEEEPINPFKAGPERVWALTGGQGDQAPQVGQLPAADIEKMLKVKQGWSLDMAQVTQTPPHYFMLSTNFVSGESQKTAEQKLDAKVEDRQVAFGDTWADLMALAVRMLRGGSMDGLELDTNWADTKPRNRLEEWQIAALKLDAGVSNDQILREQGYEQEQIDKFKEENSQGGLGQAPIVPNGVPARLSLE